MRTAAVWSGGEKRRVGWFEPSRYAERGAQPLDDPLHVEEVDRARRRTSAPGSSIPSRRRRRPGSRRRPKTRPDLEQPDGLAGRAAGCAPRRRRGPGAATAAACRTWRTADWRWIGRSTPGLRERLGGFGLDESERDRFRQAGRRQDPANEPIARNARIGRRRRRGDDRKGRRQLVEPVMPSDFFDEIDFALQIHAERRRDDVPAVGCRGDGETQPAQNPLHVPIRHPYPQQRSRCRRRWIRVAAGPAGTRR